MSTLSAEQFDTFRQAGCVTVPGAVDASYLAGMRAAVDPLTFFISGVSSRLLKTMGGQVSPLRPMTKRVWVPFRTRAHPLAV